MAVTVRSVFETVGKDLKVDRALAKRVHDYQVGFRNLNQDHIAFFGSNLLGVHPLRFRPTDREDWFNEVLDIDELDVEDGIAESPYISDDWKRASDAMNLSCVWLLHKVHHSSLTAKEKHSLSLDILLVLQYKFLGSLMAHYFPYPADEAVALATYARLSRKYALKVAGSWGNLLDTRAEDLLLPRSIHYRTVIDFNVDKDIAYMVNDIQGRLREIVKSMTKVFYDVKKEGGKIASDSIVDNIQGEQIIRDRTRQYTTWIRYAHTVVNDRNSWVRDELVNVITDAIHTMPPKQFTEVLNWMALNSNTAFKDKIETLISETLIYAFNLMQQNRTTFAKAGGVTPMLAKLRALYMASRMSDPTLLLTKSLSEEIVTAAVKTRNNSVIASLRTALQMYIVVRTMAMSYYQN